MVKSSMSDIAVLCYNTFPRICDQDYYKNKSAAGKVILCFSTIGPKLSILAVGAVKKANGAGLIFADSMSRQIADVDVIPTVSINLDQGTKLKDYLAQSPR